MQTLKLRIDEAQHEADEAQIARREQDVPSMLLLLQAPLVPVKIYRQVRRRPLATYALIAANLAVFALQAITGGLALFLHGIAPWTLLTWCSPRGTVRSSAGAWRC